MNYKLDAITNLFLWMAKLRTWEVEWFTHIIWLVNNQTKTELKIVNIFQPTGFHFLIQKLFWVHKPYTASCHRNHKGK